MIFYYKTQRGNFKIKIDDKIPETRDVYQDIRIKFIIKVTNEDNLDWKTNFSDVTGIINKIEEKNKLIEKLKERIFIYINKDEPGDFVIGDPTLDLR